MTRITLPLFPPALTLVGMALLSLPTALTLTSLPFLTVLVTITEGLYYILRLPLHLLGETLFPLAGHYLPPTILFASNLNHLARSEEHTSELQSRGHLVCRLLLEKKK